MSGADTKQILVSDSGLEDPATQLVRRRLDMTMALVHEKKCGNCNVCLVSAASPSEGAATCDHVRVEQAIEQQEAGGEP